jgi:uncharacterized protein (DUF1778 family)
MELHLTLDKIGYQESNRPRDGTAQRGLAGAFAGERIVQPLKFMVQSVTRGERSEEKWKSPPCPVNVRMLSFVEAMAGGTHMMQSATESKSERIDIRTTPSVKRVLQEAAAAKSKTVTEFMLDVALTEAAEVRANQRLFVLDAQQWNAFVAALDAPIQPKPRLAALLRDPGVFD